MPWSPIQQKKQDSRKNSGSGGWRWQGSGRVGQNLKRRWRVGIIGGPSWNRWVSTPLPYVKKDFKVFHPLHYKTNPLIPGFTAIFEKSIPLLWRWWGRGDGEGGGFGLWYVPLHSCDYLCDISIKVNVATDEDNGRNESEHWTKDEIGVTTKLALIASWTHGRIAQSVRASEPNSVAAGSNLTSCQLFVATSKNSLVVNY